MQMMSKISMISMKWNCPNVLLCLLMMNTSLAADSKASEPKVPEPMMISKGEVLWSMDFEDGKTPQKPMMGLRKSTVATVQDGLLKFLPPVLKQGQLKKDDQWASSSMSRVGFNHGLQNYICRFRFRLHKPESNRSQQKASLYTEFGHRAVRAHAGMRGAKLLLMNHLLKDQDPNTREPATCQVNEGFKLAFDKWYWFVGEIKDDQVLVRIGDEAYYGQDPWIKKDRAKVLQLNNSGAGFDLDELTIWKAGDFQADWAAKQSKLVQGGKK